jgi:hypothetical protein
MRDSLDTKLRHKIGEIEKTIRKRHFKCLHPDCNLNAINSHSQHRGGQLSLISENDIVWAMNPSFYAVISNDSKALQLIETKIKNASIYPGFCPQHDNKIFSPIEKLKLVKDDTIQASTFFLRTITYEITRKKLSKCINDEIIEKCKEYLGDELILFLFKISLGRKKFIDIDLPYISNAAFYYYKNPDSGRVQTKWVFIPKIIKVSICTTFSPIQNMLDRNLDRINGNPQALSTFNIVPCIITFTDSSFILSY